MIAVRLAELRIRDVGVIDDVSVELGSGLTVVTGETGAGKTMVVAALELLLGARADADRVRGGAERAVVEGVVAPPPPAAGDWVDDRDDELVAAREVAPGRSRARLGGRLAPASALADVLGSVVEVHGQHDTARLADPTAQRELLDRYGGVALAEHYGAYQEAYGAWREASTELAQLEEGARERAREIDRLRFELGEIDEVDPQPGEEDALEAELARLEHAEALREAARTAAAALVDDGGARDALGAGVGSLREVAGVDAELDGLLERLEGLAADAQDVALELGAHADGLELDPERLAMLRDRQAALFALTRKYGPTAEAVAAYADEARERLAELEGGDARIDELRDEVEARAQEVAATAERLRASRREAGARLADTVASHLAELAMPDATLEVAVEPTDPGPHGADRVTWQLAANPGEPTRPLSKVASGGERSRIALAVRLALADADATPVLVFDEVDAGVGGATALAVGEKLARLARGRQVLCVTHLAQLAAYADAHLVVAKEHGDDGRARAVVRELGDDERAAELARMLSGEEGEAATEHAADLIARAREALTAS